MIEDKLRRRLPAAAVGVGATCCAVHLILLAAGVGALAAAAAGAPVVAFGVVLLGGGLWWAVRRRTPHEPAPATNRPMVDTVGQVPQGGHGHDDH